MALGQSSIDAFSAILLGFAFAGVLASGFELVVRRPLGFSSLQTGDLGAVATVPVLVFSAPLIILRNTVRGRRLDGRPIPYVMLATVIACLWSLMCGRIVLDLTHLLTQA
ncbi:DUF6949 family protein [Enterovirga aerilata]|uniref:Uncharacterized protein n=1 Tax=Enterovirga aerilata TaxID=2730920 RepID=A0A849IBA2_9HYPH|nr:hypothetical protein [Enterovirga sp. DB1703]NNM73257.1 hypothetical protein [Enterovirga sp. DB1703]